MRTKLVAVLCLLSLSGCKILQDNGNTRVADPIQILMDRNAQALLSDPKLSSVSIGIYKDGVKYTSHYGELDRGKGNTSNNRTIYEIASVSKSFTGTIAARAVIDNKIKLEDDIRNYLIEDLPNLEYENEPIRIKHLLTHTSGLPQFLPESINRLFSDFNDSLPFKIHKILEGYSKSTFLEDIRKVRLAYLPGSNYQYSNADTELLAKVLENVYGRPFNKILRRHFRIDADINNTWINLPPKKDKFLANGYGMSNNLVPHEMVIFGADGGVKTTMPDLVNYMELHLDTINSTVVESQRVLCEKKNRKTAYYWLVNKDEKNGEYLSIHGGAFGTQNWLFILPKQNLGISVITNQSDLHTSDKLIKMIESLIKDLRFH